MKNYKIPSLIAVALLFLGTVAGTALIQRNQAVFTQATAQTQPKDVLISNIMDTSFTVSWKTDEPTIGFVQWGTRGNTITPAHSSGGTAKKIHSVKIMGLTPSTEYSFLINSAGESFRNNDVVWNVETGPSLPVPDMSNVVSGIIHNSDGTPASGALVIFGNTETSPLTAITSSSGSWVIPVSLARTTDLETYAATSEQPISVQVIADTGMASALINSHDSSVLPAIVIGQSYDFTTVENETAESTNVMGVSSSNVVTLESLENGEVIFTDTPEFFGSGPAGREISITVHSDPVSGNTQVEEDGNWAWSPPTDLENGLHNITIEWTDLQGIVHTLTRSFIVQAQENEPSFESTPSGSTSPSPSPTQSPTPKPTATVKPSVSPTATAKPQELPDSGSIMPSLLLATAGFVTLTLGAVLALKK